MSERSLRAHLAGRGRPVDPERIGTRTLGEHLRGCFADGWTPEDITRVAERLAPTGQRLISVWEYADAVGPGGHASLGLLVPASGDVLSAPVHAVSDWVWAWLVDAAPPTWDAWTSTTTPLILGDTQPRIGWDAHNVLLEVRP